jgi:putative heme-binding domain-containing protein
MSWRSRVVGLAVFGGICGAGAALPQERPAANARAAQARSQDGETLFLASCRICHGEAGVGNRAPALRGSRLTPEYVSQIIVEGKPGTLMPRFGNAFTETQVRALTQYVMSLQRPDSLWNALKGSPSAGERVFFDQADVRSCHNCHVFSGRGRRVGPDLTARLKGRSAREIFQKIVIVPHRSVDPAYVNVEIVRRDGERLVGIRAGETGDQLTIYDTSVLPPVVRTLARAEIVSTKPLDASAMPSDYASRLPLQQLLDLVAFLRSGVEGRPVVVSFDEVVGAR